MAMISKGPILAVEDNPDDLFLLESAVAKADLKSRLRVVRDGVEAIDYLNGVGLYADRNVHPMPGLVLLDLKLPRMSGLDFLTWMRDRAPSERIPVIVLSASSSEVDIRSAYDLGAFSYHVKSLGFNQLFALVRDIEFCLSLPVDSAVRLFPLPGAVLRPSA